jgi:hypothetical protein
VLIALGHPAHDANTHSDLGRENHHVATEPKAADRSDSRCVSEDAIGTEYPRRREVVVAS